MENVLKGFENRQPGRWQSLSSMRNCLSSSSFFCLRGLFRPLKWLNKDKCFDLNCFHNNLEHTQQLKFVRISQWLEHQSVITQGHHSNFTGVRRSCTATACRIVVEPALNECLSKIALIIAGDHNVTQIVSQCSFMVLNELRQIASNRKFKLRCYATDHSKSVKRPYTKAMLPGRLECQKVEEDII